ncbi:MAG TPA: hypothetical protein VJP41_10600 [Gaiellaceae bacterium]|nr:hypothetical protein [Gaiellaceae bacterium]
MSSELEQQLETMLTGAPEPEAGAGEEALHRALRALQPAATVHRGVRTVALAFAAALVLLAIAAGSLGAAGAIHVSFGAKQKPQHPAPELKLPNGANGVAAIVDGRLSVVTRGGFFNHVTASAAALSPRALYVAAGIRHSLVALAPDGRRAWSHPAGGNVVAIAWAPDGFRIAYVVHTGRRFVLHIIYGNGIHDTTIDRSVRAVTPSWRADSLALAYVGGGGRAVVYDVGHRRHIVVGPAAPITRLAFAPVGKRLLVATPAAAFLAGKQVASGDVEEIGWFDGRPAVALAMRTTARVRSFGPARRPLDNFVVPGRVVELTGGLVATQTADKVLAGWGRRKSVDTLLRVRPTTSVEDFAIG